MDTNDWQQYVFKRFTYCSLCRQFWTQVDISPYQPLFLFPRDALSALLTVWSMFPINLSNSKRLWRNIYALFNAFRCHQNIVIIVKPNTKQIAATSLNTLGLFTSWQFSHCPEVTCSRCCAIPRKTKQRTMKTNPTNMKILLRINFRCRDPGCCCWSSMAEFHFK